MSDEFKHDVFLSHSSIDKPRVRKLASCLESAGFSVWIDEWKIKYGASIPDGLNCGIETSRVTVFCISEASLKSSWCRLELNSAIFRDPMNINGRFLFLRLRDIELPELLCHFKRLDWFPEQNIPCEELVQFCTKHIAYFGDEHFVSSDILDIKFNEIKKARVRTIEESFSLSEFRKLLDRRGIFILFGEAGVGKTTTVNWLCQNIPVISKSKTVPVCLPLREWRADENFVRFINRKVVFDNFVQLKNAAREHELRMILFFDGWNEQNQERLSQVISFINSDLPENRTVVVTSRPVTNNDLSFTGEHTQVTRYFEIQRWTFEQLERYFEKNNCLDLLAEIPETIKGNLRLPLLAYLIVSAYDRSEKLNPRSPLKKMTDVFDYVIGEFLNDLPFNIPIECSSDLNQCELSEDLRTAFKNNNHYLGNEGISCVTSGKWLISGTVGDERYLLEEFRKDIPIVVVPKRKGGAKSVNIPLGCENLSYKPIEYLGKFALEMTKNSVVQIRAIELEKILIEPDKPYFLSLLSHLVNAGLLRCSDAVVVFDPKKQIDEIRELEVSFFHQSLQEYFTALKMISKPEPEFTSEVSLNVFWREIPIYVMQIYDDVVKQQQFISEYLSLPQPDYLTVARLLPEISDPNIQNTVRDKIQDALIKSTEAETPYSHSIETFALLGNACLNELRNSLQKKPGPDEVYAAPESHLKRASNSQLNEKAWRRLGRSIYYLGELNDIWLAIFLSQQLPNMESLHLCYHSGEALLSLARNSDLAENPMTILKETSISTEDIESNYLIPNTLEGLIISAGEKIKLYRGDVITKAYAIAIYKECGSPNASWEKEVSNKLSDFLHTNAKNTTGKFAEEYWRRAHGLEALAEISCTDKCLGTFEHVFMAEEKSEHGRGEVHSSLLKAITRLCSRNIEERSKWHPLIEKIFGSRKVNRNKWACKILQKLLQMYFTDVFHIKWIKRWKKSEGLGGDNIERVLNNIDAITRRELIN